MDRRGEEREGRARQNHGKELRVQRGMDVFEVIYLVGEKNETAPEAAPL